MVPKVRTAISVFKNFGVLEIFSLLAIKLKLKNSESIMDLTSISNNVVIEWSSLTSEFLDDLFRKFNLNSRGEEIFRPVESNLQFRKFPRWVLRGDLRLGPWCIKYSFLRDTSK